MFTRVCKRELTHLALGTSGRDCIMLQRAKLVTALQRGTLQPRGAARLPSKSF
jgi:hypothetical protein